MIHNKELASAVSDLAMVRILNNLRRATRSIYHLQVRYYDAPVIPYDPNVPYSPPVRGAWIPNPRTGPWPSGTVETVEAELDKIATALEHLRNHPHF